MEWRNAPPRRAPSQRFQSWFFNVFCTVFILYYQYCTLSNIYSIDIHVRSGPNLFFHSCLPIDSINGYVSIWYIPMPIECIRKSLHYFIMLLRFTAQLFTSCWIVSKFKHARNCYRSVRAYHLYIHNTKSCPVDGVTPTTMLFHPCSSLFVKSTQSPHFIRVIFARLTNTALRVA